VVRERAERHWWLKNAGFKLVAGKFIFRSQKIGGSRKLNWWLRNFRPTKVLWTQVHMSSRSSVQNHCHFEHYLQSLCLPVLHALRNRTKMVPCVIPWSFPMSLFLGCTVWFSLLILRISWHAAATVLNSWPSRLWSRNSSSPPSPSPHYERWENQVIWLWSLRRSWLNMKLEYAKSSLYYCDSISCGVRDKSSTDYFKVDDAITWGGRFLIFFSGIVHPDLPVLLAWSLLSTNRYSLTTLTWLI
jgi:hypothetical protein